MWNGGNGVVSKGTWLVNSTTTASQNTFGGAGATPRHPHLRAARYSGIFAGRNWPRRLSAGVHCRSRVRVWIITAGPVHLTALNPARVRVHLDGQVMWARTLADAEATTATSILGQGTITGRRGCPRPTVMAADGTVVGVSCSFSPCHRFDWR